MFTYTNVYTSLNSQITLRVKIIANQDKIMKIKFKLNIKIKKKLL